MKRWLKIDSFHQRDSDALIGKQLKRGIRFPPFEFSDHLLLFLIVDIATCIFFPLTVWVDHDWHESGCSGVGVGIGSDVGQVGRLLIGLSEVGHGEGRVSVLEGDARSEDDGRVFVLRRVLGGWKKAFENILHSLAPLYYNSPLKRPTAATAAAGTSDSRPGMTQNGLSCLLLILTGTTWTLGPPPAMNCLRVILLLFFEPFLPLILRPPFRRRSEKT